MRLALAQINTVVGDLEGNRERILRRLEEAKRAGVDLVLYPELAVTGYPPEDLLLRPGFLRAAERSLELIAAQARGIACLVGVPYFERDLYNGCAVCADGEVKAVYRKRFLPNYGVFDEDRYFQPGHDLLLLRFGETLVGPTVCEDIWQPGPPATELALAGAHVVANISASPFHVGKGAEREQMLATRARDNSCWIAFVNAVGGQDELVFDGHSLVLDEEGTVVARAPAFEDANVLRGWAGFYEITPDDNPVLGWVGEPAGLAVAAGFSGPGFIQGPAIGTCIAELILDGAATTVDITPFRPSRFAEGALAPEHNVI